MVKYYLQALLIYSIVLLVTPQGNRQGKQIVGFRIPAKICDTFLQGFSEGYCDGFASCLSNGGYLGGFCNSGFGVCCVVRRSCGGTVRTRVGYFQNRGFPSETTADGNCQVTISRYNEDVTQVRLDFEQFNLAKAEDEDDCTTESLSITGSDPRFAIPKICGNNTGNHIYVNFANTVGSTLVLNIALNGDSPSTFSIKITQYRCGNPDRAPDGCLQYFREPTGMVQSFNFPGEAIQNQFYDVCIDKANVGSCIEWTFTTLISTTAIIPDTCVAGGTYVNIPNGQLIERNVDPVNRLVYCSILPTTSSVISPSYKFQVVLGTDNLDLGFQATYKASTTSC